MGERDERVEVGRNLVHESIESDIVWFREVVAPLNTRIQKQAVDIGKFARSTTQELLSIWFIMVTARATNVWIADTYSAANLLMSPILVMSKTIRLALSEPC